MRIDRPESADAEGTGDGRRARLADVQRLETALADAVGQLKVLQDLIKKREETPIPKSEFYGNFYAMCALSGKSAKHFRAWADEAWRSYISAMQAKPSDEVSNNNDIAKDIDVVNISPVIDTAGI